MAKKHKHEEHENHERWVISYADLVTLLFALFVVLYASSQVDNNKLAETTESMRWALNFSGEGGINKLSIFKGPPTEGGCVSNLGRLPHTSPVQQQMIEAVMKKLQKQLKGFLNNRTVDVEMTVENGKLHIRLAAQRFFDAGSSAMRPESLGVLDAIADEVARSSFVILVEGHTDDEPVGTGRFRNNWDLSAARAVSVVAYLEAAHGIEPARLVPSGMGSSRPLFPNDTAEHREANRRIELVLELPPTDPRGTTPPR